MKCFDATHYVVNDTRSSIQLLVKINKLDGLRDKINLFLKNYPVKSTVNVTSVCMEQTLDGIKLLQTILRLVNFLPCKSVYFITL